jgi:alpha-galactosidase
MNIKNLAQCKFTGDEYCGFYSCGLTMLDNSSMRRFNNTYESGSQTTLTSDDGLKLTVSYEKSPYSDATEVVTSFENGSGAPVTLEMLTSFLLPEVKADKIHRILSFWSAEGRLKTDDLAELNMEHSWNNMAFRVEKFGNVGSMPVRKYFPFVALEDSETHSFTAVQLYSPASWQIELTVRAGDVVRVSGGIADRDFGQWTKTVKPGETFVADRKSVV